MTSEEYPAEPDIEERLAGFTDWTEPVDGLLYSPPPQDPPLSLLDDELDVSHDEDDPAS